VPALRVSQRVPVRAFDQPLSHACAHGTRGSFGQGHGGGARVSEPRWTPEQWAGITTVGQSLLVSAAAGSGKTAMLAERCAYLVCDAPEPYRCDVDELLVVTFTDAAAAEMKSRITSALRARAATD